MHGATIKMSINALIVWIVSECTDMNDIKTVSAQQEKDIYTIIKKIRKSYIEISAFFRFTVWKLWKLKFLSITLVGDVSNFNMLGL